MKIYDSTTPTGMRRIVAHFDENKVVAKDDPRIAELGLKPGQPDPDYCVDHTFPPYDEDNPPQTGARKEWEAKHKDDDPPLRDMTREEVETQQLEETIAIAKDEAKRKAEFDPFAVEPQEVSVD